MSIRIPADTVSRTPRSDARRFAFILLALCSLALVQRAAAQDERQGYALNWVRAPGAEACISSSRLAERVEQLLGPVLRAPDASDRAIEGLVEPAGNGFTVRLRIANRAGSALGERSFGNDAAACRELDASIVLVLALMIDPSASERGLPPELLGMLDDAATPAADLLADLEREQAEQIRTAAVAPPAPEKARPAPAAPKPHEKPPEKAPEQDSRLGLEIALVPALSYGNQPNIAPGLGLGARIDTGIVSFELSGSLWMPSEVALEQSGARALTEFKSANAALAMCLPVAQLGQLSMSACAGVAFVARWFESDGLINTPENTRMLFGPSIAADARYALSSRWFVLAGASVMAMFPEENFFYTDGAGQKQSLFEPSVIGVTAGLGIGASL